MNLTEAQHEICEIGRRLYARGFAAGNDGNLSIRLADDEVLCTPTGISKGFMTPDDLCVCDLSGRQLSGRRRLTSELLVHLAIYRQRVDVSAVVHCHPPHVTAFAITGQPIPERVLPEVELFLGRVPTVPYATPGTQALADLVATRVHESSVVVLANHGAVSYAETLERAFWWTEVLDSYCRVLLLARPLGAVVQLGADQQRELEALRAKWKYEP